MALTKYTWNSFNVTPVASKVMGWNSDADGLTTMSSGAWTLIKTLTASSSATLSFVDGSSDVVLDNTYSVYLFHFINIHPQTDNKSLQFNFSIDSGSNYNVEKNSSFWGASHDESDAGTALQYNAGNDLALATGFQSMGFVDNDNDSSKSGYLYLFEPSSTTFVKHFINQQSFVGNTSVAYQTFVSGYANTTSAVDAVQFKINSGNIDAGTIKLYGLEK